MPGSASSLQLVWDAIPDEAKPQALKVLETFAKKDGTDG